MNTTYRRYIQMIKNEQWGLILAELIAKIVNGEELNYGEKKLLVETQNKINLDFQINVE